MIDRVRKMGRLAVRKLVMVAGFFLAIITGCVVVSATISPALAGPDGGGNEGCGSCGGHGH
jgi:hypothetical protein